jgi:hypothetical protein
VVNFTLRPLYPNRKAPGTCPRAGLVGLGAGLDVLEKKKTVCPAGKRKSFLSCPVITLNTPSHDRVHHVKRGSEFHMLTELVMLISEVKTLLKSETGHRASFLTPFMQLKFSQSIPQYLSTYFKIFSYFIQSSKLQFRSFPSKITHALLVRPFWPDVHTTATSYIQMF